ncbi:MFS transporter [Naumannella huperziae]
MSKDPQTTVTDPRAPGRPANPRLGILTMALGAFGIGLTEFAPAGLLPGIAAEFAVSEGTSGWVVGAYALAVAVGAIVMSLLTAGRDRASVLRLLVAVFVVGNLVTTVAPSFGLLLTGRVIAALCHGAYVGISAALAAELLPEGRKAKGVAMVFSGITLAIVLGLPIGNLLGNQFGWRATFAVMTGIGVIVLIALIAFVPTGRGAPNDLRTETGWLRSEQVWLTLGVSVLGFGGVFGAFSYLAYTLSAVTRLGPTAIAGLLLVFGVGTFAGNLLGGSGVASRLGDRFPVIVTAVVAMIMIGFGLTAAWPIAAMIGVFAMGAVGFSLTPATQARILTWADGAGFASSANIAALNLGNWVGATLAGLALDGGHGAASPLFVGAAMTLCATGLMLWTIRRRPAR